MDTEKITLIILLLRAYGYLIGILFLVMGKIVDYLSTEHEKRNEEKRATTKKDNKDSKSQ